MSTIRKLEAPDFQAGIRIFADAYPGLDIKDRATFRDRLQKFHEEDPSANFYGLFRHDTLWGLMCLYDFDMNCLGVRIPVGGVGQIAVDLTHKKEQVAKEMMEYYLQHYRQRGCALAALYPFRPDFYIRMGFGHGTKMNRYRVRPADLPKGAYKARVRYLGHQDREALRDCYQRVAERTHGMMDKYERDLRRIFDRPEHRAVGVAEGNVLQGYLVFTFERGPDFVTNDILVRELVYETPEALSELLTFLHSQADQISRITFETQDEDFHYLLHDPRNDSGRLFDEVYHETNQQGVGLMYRVLDVPGLFERLDDRDFGGQTCTLKLAIEDTFQPQQQENIVIAIQDGSLRLADDHVADAEINLGIGAFSSLLMGTVHFRSLYRYGLAHISDTGYVDVVDRAFAVRQKPVCMTGF
jgi:predicted acetyltransferase